MRASVWIDALVKRAVKGPRPLVPGASVSRSRKDSIDAAPGTLLILTRSQITLPSIFNIRFEGRRNKPPDV